MTPLNRLRRWFAENGRHTLPWRTEMSAYRIWISEIMLQQTQTSTVIPYYHRFLKAFPDVATLAQAEESQVLRLWEGLGYYRRARQLHAAAKKIFEQNGGVFPESFDAILALPGIGRYTAGAISSFAYNQPTPILEANTARLHARLLGLKIPVASREAQKSLWSAAESWASATDSPRQIHAALMDLGSLICTPKEPRCDSCPLVSTCRAFQQGETDQIPVPAPKIAYESRHEAAVVLRRSARSEDVCLLQYTDGERWAGLWDFPRTFIPPEAKMVDVLTDFVRQTLGLKMRLGRTVLSCHHGVTKYRIFLECLEAVAQSAQKRLPRTAAGGEIRWVKRSDLEHYPLNTTGREIVRQMDRQMDRADDSAQPTLNLE